MNIEEIESLAKSLNDESLSKKPGMVAMVWQDGEVTLQKSGELLWQRSLHMSECAIFEAAALKMTFPNIHGSNSFAWVSTENAIRIRDEIRILLGRTNDDTDKALRAQHASETGTGSQADFLKALAERKF